MTANPTDVWKLIERADERVKYAQNRDATAAYTQALDHLDEAERLLADVEDPRARAGLAAQIERRRSDIDGFTAERGV